MLNKKLVSLIGASIISISLVGCQSTQSLEEYIEANVDNEVLIVSGSGYNFGTYDEFKKYDSNVKHIEDNDIYEDLSELKNYDIDVYNDCMKALENRDLEELKNLYKYHYDNDYGPDLLYKIRVATSDFTTFDYIGFNVNACTALWQGYTDQESIDHLDEIKVEKDSKYSGGTDRDIKQFDFIEWVYSLYYHELTLILNNQEVPMEENKETPSELGICHDCGQELPINSMMLVDGYLHCGCTSPDTGMNGDYTTCPGCGNEECYDEFGCWICGYGCN